MTMRKFLLPLAALAALMPLSCRQPVEIPVVPDSAGGDDPAVVDPDPVFGGDVVFSATIAALPDGTQPVWKEGEAIVLSDGTSVQTLVNAGPEKGILVSERAFLEYDRYMTEVAKYIGKGKTVFLARETVPYLIAQNEIAAPSAWMSGSADDQINSLREYYAINPPEEGQTFAVSVRNPTTGEEKETLIGGKFETKDGSGKDPYPGVKSSKHLGPTLTMDVKLPVINAVGGLATMDDLVSSDGMIPLEGVDAENATKVTVEQYVEDYCEEGFKLNGDISQVNMHRS